MRKFLSFVVMALGLIAMTSCSKSLSKALPGTYHFKMSGSFWAINYDEYDDVTTYCRFHMASQAGQMKVMDKGNGEFIVNMSVMLGGDIMPFKATLSGDDILLNKHEVSVKIVEEGLQSGSAFSGLNINAKTVSMVLYGEGRRYEENLEFLMHCEPGHVFYYEDEKYTVIDETEFPQDIICTAFKEE